MSNQNLSTPKFGSHEYREYYRTTYIEEGKWKYFKFKTGKTYCYIIFSILIIIPTLLAFQISEFKTYFWCLMPVYFLFCNFLEYVIHRYPMHHKTKGFENLFEHVTVHHSFYNADLYYFEKPRDYMAVFIPMLYALFICSGVIFAALGIYFLVDLDNALLFSAFGFSYYLMYEVLHFSFHAPDNSFIKKIPFMKKLSRLHLFHHRAQHMTNYNFNITFPIFDVIFGTLYKTKKQSAHPQKEERLPLQN